MPELGPWTEEREREQERGRRCWEILLGKMLVETPRLARCRSFPHRYRAYRVDVGMPPPESVLASYFLETARFDPVTGRPAGPLH